MKTILGACLPVKLLKFAPECHTFVLHDSGVNLLSNNGINNLKKENMDAFRDLNFWYACSPISPYNVPSFCKRHNICISM